MIRVRYTINEKVEDVEISPIRFLEMLKEDLEGKISNQIKQIEDKFNNQLNYIDETKERLKFNSRVKL